MVILAGDFFCSDHDPAMFIHLGPRGRTILLLYVDDMLLTGDDPDHIASVKKYLSEQFLMSDLDPLRYFLGIEITSTADGIQLSQRKYAMDLLSCSRLTNSKIAATPMELDL